MVTTEADADLIMRTNFSLSRDLWDWCALRNARMIYASSAATYGDGTQGFNDDQHPAALDQLAPLNLYGWSKHQFDKWAVERAAEGKAPPQWAGLKFFNVYGPNEYHKGDMQSLVAKNTALIARGETIRLFKGNYFLELGCSLEGAPLVTSAAPTSIWPAPAPPTPRPCRRPWVAGS